MRFIFKTEYAQDIGLAKHEGHVFWYSALVLLLLGAPWLFTAASLPGAGSLTSGFASALTSALRKGGRS
jgi:hypothetical protein